MRDEIHPRAKDIPLCPSFQSVPPYHFTSIQIRKQIGFFLVSQKKRFAQLHILSDI